MKRECSSYGYVCQSVLANQKLSFSAKTVYSVLCTFAQSKDVCYPSIRTIHKLLGGSFSTIKKAIEDLEKEGVIAAEKSHGRTSLYRLLIYPSSVTKTVTPTVTENEKSVTDFEDTVTENVTGVLQNLNESVTKTVTEEYKEEDNKKSIKEKEYIYIPPFELNFLTIAQRNAIGYQLSKMDKEDSEAWHRFVNWAIKNACTKLFRFKKPILPDEYIKLINTWSKETEREVLQEKIEAIQNQIDVLDKFESAFRTVNTYCLKQMTWNEEKIQKQAFKR